MKGYLKQDGEPTPDKPIKIEAKIPMFVDGELENFDNNIHSIIEEYSKMMFKEKDQILTQRIIMKQEQEIERLNNIINETRRILGEYRHYSTPDEIQNMFNEEIVDKAYEKLHSNLQKLKGDSSNG